MPDRKREVTSFLRLVPPAIPKFLNAKLIAKASIFHAESRACVQGGNIGKIFGNAPRHVKVRDFAVLIEMFSVYNVLTEKRYDSYKVLWFSLELEETSSLQLIKRGSSGAVPDITDYESDSDYIPPDKSIIATVSSAYTLRRGEKRERPITQSPTPSPSILLLLPLRMIDITHHNNTPSKMTTFVRELEVKDIKSFDGTSADLASFDNLVQMSFLMQNLPSMMEGVSLGTLTVIILKWALTPEMLNLIKHSGANAQLSCWRAHSDMRTPIADANSTMKGLYLYDLLRRQFTGKIDAATVETELRRYCWKPSRKDGLSITAFKTSECLLKRAEKTSTIDRIHCIRNVLPQSLKEKTEKFDSGEEL
ncbi:hypothetical protein BDZ91DRAFT_760330 [Kalaharituber pfeilii]|nr:hypothetical protein BDZ91DRAFT_760330 [Kalaharituber pfeilii]